jgi:hypothetical protein
VPEIIASPNRMHGLAIPMDEVFVQKESLYLAALPQLQAMPELLEHIHASQGSIRFAMVCAGDCQRGKPPPEPFLTAARLVLSPSRSHLKTPI